jgi:hypothetical protein
VDVSYSVNFIGSRHTVGVLQYPSGFYFLNYAIEPETLSVDYYLNKYVTGLKMTVRVTDSEDRTILQHSRDFHVELEKEDLNRIGERPFHLMDSFPLIPGDYKVSLLFENTVSKEFTTVEKEITVPEPGVFGMSPLILSDRIVKDSDFEGRNRAFQIGSLQLIPSVRNLFSQKKPFYVFSQIYGLTPDQKESSIVRFVFQKEGGDPLVSSKKINDFHDKRILQEFSLESRAPGNYQLEVSILDNGVELASRKAAFFVVASTVADPWLLSPPNPPLSNPVYHQILGSQYLNKGEYAKAQKELEKACFVKPDSLEFALDLAKILLSLRAFARIRQVLLPFEEAGKQEFFLFYYLGRSFHEAGEYEEAISRYRKALSHRGNLAPVLNAIGDCYLPLGNEEEALRAFRQSLEVNPDQESIKRKVEMLETNKK